MLRKAPSEMMVPFSLIGLNLTIYQFGTEEEAVPECVLYRKR